MSQVMSRSDNLDAVFDSESFIEWVDQIADKFEAEWQASYLGLPLPRIEFQQSQIALVGFSRQRFFEQRIQFHRGAVT